MCQFNDGFKLCSCSKSDIKKDSSAEGYVWELRTLDRLEFAQGRCGFPTKDIGNGLEHEWVGINLNCENCFDFAYEPKAGDNLVIYKTGNKLIMPYHLSFIYKNGSWGEGFYDEISEISKLKLTGKVKKC